MTQVKQKKILDALKVKQTLPINLIAGDEPLFRLDLNKEFGEVFIHEINNVNVTPSGIIFTGLKIFKQFLVWPSHVKEFNIIYLVKNYIKRKKLNLNNSPKLIVCFDYWSDGYFHWICDFLPRLMLLENELNDVTVLLPQNFSGSFVEPSLNAMGVKNILRFPELNYVHCKLAIIPGYVTPSGDNNPEVMLKIQNKLLAYFKNKINANTYNSNVYVSRAKAKGRMVLNEKEVIILLETFGFKIFYFEEHSFSEQISICYSAKNLVGIHGANLTNIIFMKPNANILEFRKYDDCINNYYFSLASSLKINYYYQKCVATDIKNEQTFDLVVDLNELKKNVIEMLRTE